MKSVPKHIKPGDLIEVQGLDWSTVVEWVDWKEIEQGTPIDVLRIPGYYIGTEPSGMVVWAGMIDVFGSGKVNTKYVHYMDIGAIRKIILVKRADSVLRGNLRL